MIEFVFTLLLFFGLGIVGLFVFAVVLQKRMSKDYQEKEKKSKREEPPGG